MDAAVNANAVSPRRSEIVRIEYVVQSRFLRNPETLDDLP